MMAARISYRLVNKFEAHSQSITFAMIFLAKPVPAPIIISQPENNKKMFITSWCTGANTNHANYPGMLDLVNYVGKFSQIKFD